MDRLTARSPKGLAYLVNVKPNEQTVDSEYPNTLRCILESFKRLAAYEDTGLAPEEINALAKSQIETASDNANLRTEIEPLRAENTEMKSALNGRCWCCKNATKAIGYGGYSCNHLKHHGVLSVSGNHRCERWEWRGVQNPEPTPQK